MEQAERRESSILVHTTNTHYYYFFKGTQKRNKKTKSRRESARCWTYWSHLYWPSPRCILQPETCSAPPSGRQRSCLQTETHSTGTRAQPTAVFPFIMGSSKCSHTIVWQTWRFELLFNELRVFKLHSCHIIRPLHVIYIWLFVCSSEYSQNSLMSCSDMLSEGFGKGKKRQKSTPI